MAGSKSRTIVTVTINQVGVALRKIFILQIEGKYKTSMASSVFMK